MARIRYVVHGRGRGHATRALAVISLLEDHGHSVSIAGGRDALPVLQEGRATTVEEAASLMPGVGVAATVRGLVGRVSAERVALVRDEVEAVISDGDMPAVLAAKLLGLPSIAIGHGLVFSHGRPPEGVSGPLWRQEARKARAASWGSTRQVAVNFTEIEATSSTVTMARPEIRPELKREAPTDTIVAYFRDDNGEAALRALVSRGHRPVLFSDGPCRVDGVEVRPRDPNAFTQALCRARAVVSSAGSQLISECAHLGVPQFALFSQGDAEQALNVQMLEASGLGGGCSFSSLDAEAIDGFLATCDEERAQGQHWDAPTAAEAVQGHLGSLLS